jgi:hypothetical protein
MSKVRFEINFFLNIVFIPLFYTFLFQAKQAEIPLKYYHLKLPPNKFEKMNTGFIQTKFGNVFTILSSVFEIVSSFSKSMMK